MFCCFPFVLSYIHELNKMIRVVTRVLFSIMLEKIMLLSWEVYQKS